MQQRDLVRDFYLLRGAAHEDLAAVDAVAERSRQLAGTTVFHEGDRADAMYLVAHGTVYVGDWTGRIWFAAKSGVELERLVGQRLLEVAQSFVRRQLDDEVGLRVTASRDGVTFLAVRMKLMEFLDLPPDALTPKDFEDFLRPRIGFWDIDLETRAMRIVLRSQEIAPRQKRALSI